MKLGQTASKVGAKAPDASMVARVKARILAEKKAASAEKTKPASKPTATPKTAAAPAAPAVDPNTARATADAALEYGDAQSKITGLIGQANAHQSTIDRVYDAYKKAQASAQAQHDSTQAAVMAGMQAGAATALGNAGASVAATDQGAQQQNQITQADTGQNATVQQRIAQALASNVNQAHIDQGQVAAAGAADQGFLSSLGLIAQTQQGMYHEKTQDYANSLLKDKVDLGVKEKAAVIAGKAKYDDADAAAQQQQVTNLLAQASLASKDKATQAKYDAAIAAIQGRTAVAQIGATSRENVAGTVADTAATQGRLNRQNDARLKRLDVATKKEIAAMTAAGTSPSATVTYQDLGTGQTVVLSGDKRQAWSKAYASYRAGLDKAGKLIAAHAGDKTTSEQRFRDLASKLHNTTGLPLAVARAALYNAQHPGPLTDSEYIQILRGYFPGGLVPGPLAKGVGFKRA